MAECEEPQGETDARIASLENKVAALERSVASMQQRVASADHATPAPAPAAIPVNAIPRSPRPTIAVMPSDPGQWVNRLGIVLLLLGAALGFKYSIDHGWINAPMRVIGGLGLATLLVHSSTRVRGTRPGLARLLAGGGIACAYLSLYAAFHLYELLPHAVAFAAMSIVTAIGFTVAIHDDEATSAMVAAAGGLATPFLLANGGGNVAELVVYTCVVVSGASAVYTWRGWTAVLATATTGAWIVLAAATLDATCHGSLNEGVSEGGILFVALATWWLSVVRDTVAAEDPASWPPATAGLGVADDPTLFLPDAVWPSLSHQLTLVTPVVVLFLSQLVWKTDGAASGWIALSLAVGWGLAALHLSRIRVEAARRLASTHAVAAAVMLAFAMCFVLEGDARRVGLAAEALALILLDSRARNRTAALTGHLLFLAVGMETFTRLVDAIERGLHATPATDASTLAVIAALAAAAWLLSRSAGDLYFFFTEAGLLTWLLRVLAPMTNGDALVTAAWFTNAIVLVVAGLRCDSTVIRTAGAAVMTLTMAKLFVVDLAKVDALWRIASFLGFGAVLLALGYAFPVLWRRSPAAGDRSSPA